MTDTSSLPWFAVHVRTRSEVAVAASLERKALPIFVPTYQEVRQYSDRLKKVQSALFPGYVFCRLDPERYLPVLTTPGVHAIVCTDDKPSPIGDEVIEAIRKVVHSAAAAKPWPFLKIGQKIKIMIGSMTGVEGFLVKEKGMDRLVLSIPLLQRSISVEIERTWIQPIGS